MKFVNKANAAIVEELAQEIQDKKEYLSEIDGAIGDGDHGVNMAKGFKLSVDNIHNEGAESFSEAMNVLGRTLIMDIGGSMGPLYGTFFREMGKAGKNLEEIDKKQFGVMLDAAQAGLKRFDKAQVGDKTLQDTLVPAISAYHKAVEEGKTFDGCLADMEEAARNGWESTKDMVAKIGRASRLGERSRGFYDAGATSCYLILKSLANSISKRLK